MEPGIEDDNEDEDDGNVGLCRLWPKLLVQAGEFDNFAAAALDANSRHDIAIALQGDDGLGTNVR
jgi:hypothetical protein